MEIIIKTSNPEQDKYLLAILKSIKQLGIKIEERNKKQKTKNGAAASKILKSLSDKGGVSSIADAAEWQNEIRKDRKL